MSEFTPPDGQQPPAPGGPGHPPPPRFGEVTQPNPGSPPTVMVPPAGGPPPPGPPTGGPGGPGGPDDPTAPNPGGGDGGNGRLIAGVIAAIVAVIGAVGFFLISQSGDDGDTADEPDTTENEPVGSNPAGTAPESVPVTASPTMTAAPETTTPVSATGSVDALFVRIEPFDAAVADAEVDATLDVVGTRTGDNPVATESAVLSLCAAIALDDAAMASVQWTRDAAVVVQNPARLLEGPADGDCLSNDGNPLEPGAYEVSFTDVSGGESDVALFSVGAATVQQPLLNDSGSALCAIDVGPTTAAFFQRFGVDADDPIVPGEVIDIAIAAVEQDVRGVDCDGNELDSVQFTPGTDPVSLTNGTAVPPTPQISDEELGALVGNIGALSRGVEEGSADEAELFDELVDPTIFFDIAVEDRTETLCAAFAVPGPLEGEMIWEFNGEFFTSEQVSAVDGRIGSCIGPRGVPEFGEGAYQAYVQRDGFISPVSTLTVGRRQTALTFVNDTGVQICSIGFSPALTAFFTFVDVGAPENLGRPLGIDEAFVIDAPFIENDIQSRDCSGNLVSEAFNIPPTDQTLSLSTGLP